MITAADVVAQWCARFGVGLGPSPYVPRHGSLLVTHAGAVRAQSLRPRSGSATMSSDERLGRLTVDLAVHSGQVPHLAGLAEHIAETLDRSGWKRTTPVTVDMDGELDLPAPKAAFHLVRRIEDAEVAVFGGFHPLRAGQFVAWWPDGTTSGESTAEWDPITSESNTTVLEWPRNPNQLPMEER